MHKGINLKKSKKKSPQRGLERFEYRYNCDHKEIISSDYLGINTYNELVHETFRFMIDEQMTCDHNSFVSYLKKHLRN